MTRTFSERLRIATEGMPRGVQARLAAACGISPPSVNAWFSGDTKTIGADLLFPAARFLNVNPEWLATGKGPVHSCETVTEGAGIGSQSVRFDVETLDKALRFTKLWLTATGDRTPIERHAALVMTAAEVIGTLEDNIGSEEELAQVMARLAAMGGVDAVDRGKAGGADTGAR